MFYSQEYIPKKLRLKFEDFTTNFMVCLVAYPERNMISRKTFDNSNVCVHSFLTQRNFHDIAGWMTVEQISNNCKTKHWNQI